MSGVTTPYGEENGEAVAANIHSELRATGDATAATRARPAREYTSAEMEAAEALLELYAAGETTAATRPPSAHEDTSDDFEAVEDAQPFLELHPGSIATASSSTGPTLDGSSKVMKIILSIRGARC